MGNLHRGAELSSPLTISLGACISRKVTQPIPDGSLSASMQVMEVHLRAEMEMAFSSTPLDFSGLVRLARTQHWTLSADGSSVTGGMVSQQPCGFSECVANDVWLQASRSCSSN